MNFNSLGLIKPLLQAIEEQGYKEPSPIQAQAIPPILKGEDVLASAQTGTGKTASFVLPVLQNIHLKPPMGNNSTRVLIMTPTRELAGQVYDNVKEYGKHLDLRAAVVFGGVKINPQMMKLRGGVEVLIATPGRLLDLLQQNAIKLDKVEVLILDEADRMLDMGFIHDIKRILKVLPYKRQNLLFSATFSPEIRALAKDFMKNPAEINVAPLNTTAVTVKQTVHPVDKARKASLLSHLLHKHKWVQTLVFSKTKHGANKLVKQLTEAQIYAAAIHGNKSQSQRTKILAHFKAGELPVLVATDIAARGIDIEELPCVINFDLPQIAEDYVHRIGRTGRAGSSGQAISLVCADEIGQLQAIERLIKCKLQRVEIEDFEPNHNLPSSAAPAVRRNVPNKRNAFSNGNKSGASKTSNQASNTNKKRRRFNPSKSA